MKQRVRLAVMALFFSLTAFMTAAYGAVNQEYLSDTRQMMEQIGGNVGPVFPTEEAARDFARYFYRCGYWGNVPVTLGIVSWPDWPGHYEMRAFSDQPDLAAEQQDEVEGRIKELADAIAAESEDTNRRLEAVYSWIYDNMDYDYTLESQNLYTAFRTGKTVCFGYASLFQALCERLGAESEMIYGDNHVWNRVKMDGTWKYVDITWDKNLQEHRFKFLPEETWNRIHVSREAVK